MRRHLRFVVGAPIAAALFAIPLSGQTVRDSAGVRIVDNARPRWNASEALVLSSLPRLRIGDTTVPATRFTYVRGVIRLADGRIAVVDGRSLELRLFSPEGRPLSVHAGRGEAPGQLSNSISVVRRLDGDTIALGSNTMISLYDHQGRFVRTTALLTPPPPPPPPGATQQASAATPPAPRALTVVLAILGNGVPVAAEVEEPTSHPVGARWTASLTPIILGGSGEIRRRLDRLAYLEFERTPESERGRSIWLAATAVVVGGAERFYAGFGRDYLVRVYSSDGTLTSIVRRAWTPTPITDEDWEAWVVGWSKLWVTSTGEAREREIQGVRDEPWADELPAFSQFLEDRDGRLWVREAHWQDAVGAGNLSDRPAIPSLWSVFDREGMWLGDVTMPTDFQPFEIGSDYVAGIQRADGVSHVVLYGLGPHGQPRE